MANPKEKTFTLNFKTHETNKLHNFIDSFGEECGDKKKYLHWARFLPNFYTLSTLEYTSWTVGKLTDAIYKHMKNEITFIVFEVQDSKVQGRMKDEYWSFWKESRNLTTSIKNKNRSRKLKKITDYIKRESELKRKEEELKNRRIELEKSLTFKKREDDLKRKEKELLELESQLIDDDGNVVDEPKTKKRWWYLK